MIRHYLRKEKSKMDKANSMPINAFNVEEEKLVELKQSTNVEDLLTALLMEVHAGMPFSDESDSIGLIYNFARPKAVAILKRFNVTAKEVTDGTNAPQC